MGWQFYPPFTGEDTGVQRGEMNGVGSHKKYMIEPGFKSRPTDSKAWLSVPCLAFQPVLWTNSEGILGGFFGAAGAWTGPQRVAETSWESQLLCQVVTVDEKNPCSKISFYANMSTLLLANIQAPVLETRPESSLSLDFCWIRSVCVILSKPDHLWVPQELRPLEPHLS